MAETILLAGGSGALGRHVAQSLKVRGLRVRVLTRDAGRLASMRHLADEVFEADALDAAKLAGVCEGVDRVFSCLGANVQPDPRFGRKSFTRLDTPANRNLIDMARAARVKRFVYVSTFHSEAMTSLEYVRGHEAVVDLLRETGLDYSVVRPTGFFSALEALLKMASAGLIVELGNGLARSNPIHDADLAEVCVEALDGGPRERSVGGPMVYSRREIAHIAFAALGRPPRIVGVPLALARLGGLLMRPVNPRVSHLVAFYASIMAQDLIAPLTGSRTIDAFFRERAAAYNVKRLRG